MHKSTVLSDFWSPLLFLILVNPGIVAFTRNERCWLKIRLKVYCERFEPRSHFKSRLSLIVRVNVVLNRTVVDSDWRFDNLCGSHLQSQSELYYVSWYYYTLVIDLIGQLRRDVIGRLSVKPRWYWVWRLVISNWCVSSSQWTLTFLMQASLTYHFTFTPNRQNSETFTSTSWLFIFRKSCIFNEWTLTFPGGLPWIYVWLKLCSFWN